MRAPRSALETSAVSPFPDFYFLARSSSIATAGCAILPSTNSRNAAASGDERFCRQCRTGQLPPDKVAAASDGDRFAVQHGVSHDLVPFAEVRELNTPTGPFHEWFPAILQDFSRFLSGSITDIQDCSVSFTSLTDFRAGPVQFQRTGCYANIRRNRMLQVVSRRLAYSQPGRLRSGFYPHRVCRDKGVSDTTTSTISWSAILDKESRNDRLVDT